MKIKIGTRTSKLAMVQTNLVINKIKEIYPNIETEVVELSTKGDRIQDKPISALGDGGFVLDIENALKDGDIDIAVHSAKDLPVNLADGLEISGVLKRGDYRDAIITRKGVKVKNSPDFYFGTSCLRRELNVLRLYPKAGFKNIRGNVDVRMNKLLNNEYDAIVLAMAGLERLGYDKDERFNIQPFDYDEFITSPCQGIIAIESRKDDFVTPIIRGITDETALYSYETERYINERLNPKGDLPLGAYTYVTDDRISVVASLNGKRTFFGETNLSNRLEYAGKLELRI